METEREKGREGGREREREGEGDRERGRGRGRGRERGRERGVGLAFFFNGESKKKGEDVIKIKKLVLDFLEKKK